MAKVYLTDEHYFQCSGGVFPAHIYDGKSTHVSKTGKHYLTHYDTATKTPDFTCRWAVVLAVMAAVFFALLASNPIGWAILAGLIIGLGTGFLLCGVMMAGGRKWIGYEQHLIIKRTQYALTSDSYMMCPLGGKISWAPEITSPGIALWTGLRNTGFATFQGIMYGYAAYGSVSLFTTSGLEAVGINLLKGWAKTYGKAGLMVRTGFAAENVVYRNATRQYEGGETTDMLKDAGKTFVGDVYQYYKIGTKFANGEQVGAEEIANAVTAPFSMVGLNIQTVNADYQIPYTLRRIANKGYIGGSKLLFKRDIVSSRQKVAVDFYKKVYDERIKNGMDITDATKVMESELSGIDYQMPVRVILLKKGTKLYQYQKHNTKGNYAKGQYYTDNSSNSPSQLGISECYSVKDENYRPSNQIDKVNKTPINIEEDSYGLQSTSAPIDDTWNLQKNGENIPVKTEGTGSQIYIPKENQAMKGSITVPKQKIFPIYPNNQK